MMFSLMISIDQAEPCVLNRDQSIKIKNIKTLQRVHGCPFGQHPEGISKQDILALMSA